MSTQPKAKIDGLIKAHPKELVKNASQDRMRLRVHTKAETQSLNDIGKASDPTMPFEANMERVTIESEWEDLLELVFKAKPHTYIQSKLMQESMLWHKALIEHKIPTEATAEIEYVHMTPTQPENFAHNFPSLYDNSAKDTKSQRHQAMSCDHLSQVPAPVNHFVQESGEMSAEASDDLDKVWHYIRKGYMHEANICITDFFTQQDSELDQLHHEIAPITSKQCQISPWADENAGLDLSPATPVTMQNH